MKSNQPHVVILNDVARAVMESRRGQHKDYVFIYRNESKEAAPDRVDTMNNTAWQNARKRVELVGVRVHDLRHTFGQRLRQAEVAAEDRSVLMGHACADMGEHYATPTIARLIELANRVQVTRDTSTVLRIVNGR